MKFKRLAEKLSELEKTSSRLTMTSLIVSLLSDMDSEEVRRGVYLILGRLAPSYEGGEFNLAEKMVIRAAAVWLGLAVEDVTGKYKTVGDLGVVIEEMGKDQKGEEDLSVLEVYERLKEIAVEGGSGSQERKVNLLTKLLKSLDSLSRRFATRIVLGKLRLGFSDKTILDALSVLTEGNKSARKVIEAAYQIQPDPGLLVEVVKRGGLKDLKSVKARVGVPVMPALCQRLNTASEIVEKMGEVGVERKYDGTRVQIHFKKDELIKTYTRNLEENSWMFPELTQMAKWVKANDLILDAEAVGINPDNGEILPFQMTITRKRKHLIEETASKVPLRFYLFDILVKNGEGLLELPYGKRREILKETIKENETLVINEMIRTEDVQMVHAEHERYLKEGYEGAVIKKWDGVYLPGRQGWNWVKIKESEGTTGKLSDTLDLVIMGYYRGRGKRAGFGLGAFLAGVVGNGEVLTIAKIGTGLSDETFRQLKERLDGLVTLKPDTTYKVDKNLIPDVWVAPKLVVEIAADEITKSPIHTAGVALRFPRLVRIRDDKSLDGVTEVDELKQFSR